MIGRQWASSKYPMSVFPTNYVSWKKLRLSPEDMPATLGEFRRIFADSPPFHAINPMEIWDLADNLGIRVDILWTGLSAQGAYDVVFQKDPHGPNAAAALDRSDEEPKPWQAYANNPGQAWMTRQLIPDIRRLLQQHLPRLYDAGCVCAPGSMAGNVEWQAGSSGVARTGSGSGAQRLRSAA